MADLSRHWQLDPGVDFLNHGSFGSVPKVVLADQRALREEMDANFDRFELSSKPNELFFYHFFYLHFTPAFKNH